MGRDPPVGNREHPRAKTKVGAPAYNAVIPITVDERLLAITSMELVAAEGHYHRSCYRAYTRGESATSSGLADAEQDAADLYKTAEKQALQELLLYIRTQLLPSHDIVPMATVRKRFEELMLSHGQGPKLTFSLTSQAGW